MVNPTSTNYSDNKRGQDPNKITMLNLEVLISNNEKLYKTLEKSKEKRYRLLDKNKAYVTNSRIQRAKDLEQPYPIKDMERGRREFIILCYLMCVRTMMSGIRVIQYNPYKKKSDKPVIFVPTHIGKFDIEIIYECIKEHALLLSGTEERMHGSLDGYFLERCGVNYVDRDNAADRKNSVLKQKRDLENGFNLLWFIEGTWNLSENQLVYDTSYSVIKTALECDVEIVPVGLNQVGKTVYVNFGEAYTPDDSIPLTEAIEDLRGKLASLKWDLYEYSEAKAQTGVSIQEFKNNRDFFAECYYCTKRSSIDDDYWADFVRRRVKEWPMTDLVEESRYIYQPKDDAHQFFNEFNSRTVILPDGKKLKKRI